MLRPDAALEDPYIVSSVAALEALYGPVFAPAVAKEIDYISAAYQRMIEASPFVVVATVGAGGLDCSPRGDPSGFVLVVDEKTLVLPDRRGNNRLDSMRNLLVDPRIALLFLIPGLGETLRVCGRAKISTDPELSSKFVVQGKEPVSCLIVDVDAVYFQCTKAIVRSKLWDPGSRVDRVAMPTAGDILAEITDGRLGGAEHDRKAAELNKATLY